MNGTQHYLSGTNVPTKVLPLSLQYLQLRHCNRATFGILLTIYSLHRDRLNLKHIDLFLQTCARTSICLFGLINLDLASFYTGLVGLGQKGVMVTFYNTNGKTVDIYGELLALQHITFSDRTVASQADKQYSDFRMSAVKRRRTSPLERRLFARHGQSHFDLLNSTTFQGEKWADTAFFHGCKSMRWETAPEEDKNSQDIIKYSRIVQKLKPNRKTFLDLSEFEFMFSSTLR